MTTTAVTEQPDTEVVPPMADLTGHDRCDRCRAQAYYRVELYSGRELTFCIHHYRKHEADLDEHALRVRDESGRLDTPASNGVE